MKRKVAMVMAAMLAVVSMTGCGSSSSSADTATEPKEATEENVTPATEETLPEATEETASEETAAEEAEDTKDAGTSGEPTELVVFAAASMTETLNQIAEMYKTVAPDVTLTFNFDSSGTLKTQIQEGADCDLFISAGQKQMNQLDITASAEENTEGLDYVAEGTRLDILENKVTLCVPSDNPAGINSFDDLAEALKTSDILFAMGNSDVPVGQYTQKILEYYELNEEDLANAGKITYGTNVKEVTTQITEASVDAGVVYCTDAYSAGLTPVAYATPEMCGQVIYPAAVMKNSKNADAAAAFLEYLTGAEAMQVFENVGFTKVE